MHGQSENCYRQSAPLLRKDTICEATGETLGGFCTEGFDSPVDDKGNPIQNVSGVSAIREFGADGFRRAHYHQCTHQPKSKCDKANLNHSTSKEYFGITLERLC
jgi:hypothetical protein